MSRSCFNRAAETSKLLDVSCVLNGLFSPFPAHLMQTQSECYKANGEGEEERVCLMFCFKAEAVSCIM